MEKTITSIMVVFLVLCSAVVARAAVSDDAWVYMPSGVRPTYFGIHGGTVPVSLLVSDDGAALVSFVGKTGNDFLDILRRSAHKDSFLGKRTASFFSRIGSLSLSRGSTLLAGGAGDSLPVVRAGAGAGYLLPFGFSEQPLSIEGHALPPHNDTPILGYRLTLEPHYLQPRK